MYTLQEGDARINSSVFHQFFEQLYLDYEGWNLFFQQSKSGIILWFKILVCILQHKVEKSLTSKVTEQYLKKIIPKNWILSMIIFLNLMRKIIMEERRLCFGKKVIICFRGEWINVFRQSFLWDIRIISVYWQGNLTGNKAPLTWDQLFYADFWCIHVVHV